MRGGGVVGGGKRGYVNGAAVLAAEGVECVCVCWVGGAPGSQVLH